MRVVGHRGRKRRIAGRGALAGLLAVTAMAGVGAGTASASAGHMFVVAHRGDTDDAPEETLPAYADAIKGGADGIELDVRYTKDGKAIGMHDATVDRTTNCSGAVSSLTFAKLEKCDAGSWFGPAFEGQRVATVNKTLQYVANRSSTLKVFLHIKTTLTQSKADALMKSVRADGMVGRVIFVVENDPNGHKLHNAGVAHSNLARMVHTMADFNRGYAILVPYADADDLDLVSKSVVSKAVAAGELVLPVQGSPASLAQIIAAGANGVYANDLHGDLATLVADALR